LRYGVGGFALNGKGYVACGWHTGSPALTDLWQYDPTSDAWTQKASLPGAGRYSCISVATSTKAYLGLGYTPWMNDWWEYDPDLDTWTAKASFPMVGRQAANAFVIDDQVYVGLGARDVVASTATLYDDWYRYDPLLDTWTAIAPLPAPPRLAAYAFSFNGIGYVMGGAGVQGSTKVVYNDMWAYSPPYDQWLMMGLFPGTPMNAGIALPTSTSVFMGTGGVGLGDANWVPTGLTDAWWEYRPGGIASVEETSSDHGLLAFQQGDELVIRREISTSAATIELIDVSGRKASGPVTLAPTVMEERLAIGQLASGVYVLRMVDGEQIIAERVVID
jgi:N-acetylneuraminic acid mutarotase